MKNDKNTEDINNNHLSKGKNFKLITKKISKTNKIKNIVKDKFNKHKMIIKFIFIFICLFIILKFDIYLKGILMFLFKPSPQPLLNIYISAHKDFVNSLTSPVYKILCDVKSQLKKIYNLTIIETNKDNILYPKRVGYSEGSKMYYIWKLYKEGNLNSKYVGFIHYRRIFNFKNTIPNLDEIFKNYDVILNKRCYLRSNVGTQYNYYHIPTFLSESIDIIRNNYPEYYQYAISVLVRKWVYFCNLFIYNEKRRFH